MFSSRRKKKILSAIVAVIGTYILLRHCFLFVYTLWKSKSLQVPCVQSTSAEDILEPSQHIELFVERNSTWHAWPWGEEEDLRQRCRSKTYDLDALPQASVIISFFNEEDIEMLVHTVHSILQNSPPQLLREVILVDDASTNEQHKKFLDNYARLVFKSKVRIIRYKGDKPQGLIKSRLLGIRSSSTPVVIVTDAHMEAQKGWLEPLLYEIHRDRRVMLNFYLDTIKWKNGKWKYEHLTSRRTTGWYWEGFAFTMWEHDSLQERSRLHNDPTLPVPSASSIGHWAMDRSFFEEIGAMDEGMDFWGGENIDLAIRTYLWGGHVYNVPCSHVAHIEKEGGRDYRYTDNRHLIIWKNFVRIAEVWLDEFKEVFYHYNPEKKLLSPGHLEERFDLKKRCPGKFRDFLAKGYPQLGWPTMPGNLAHGGVRCTGMPDMMLYHEVYFKYGMRKPQGHAKHEDVFLTKEGHLRLQLNSFDVEKIGNNHYRVKHNYYFNQTTPRAQWLHKKGGVLKDMKTNLCLVCLPDNNHINVAKCNESDPYQQWTFENYTEAYSQVSEGQTVDILDKQYLIGLKTHMESLN